MKLKYGNTNIKKGNLNNNLKTSNLKLIIKDENTVVIAGKNYTRSAIKGFKIVFLILTIILFLIGVPTIAFGGIIFIIIGIITLLQYINYKNILKEMMNKSDINNIVDVAKNEKNVSNQSVASVVKNDNLKKSSRKFMFFDDENRYLRYEYYDIEIKGIEYRNFDISKIEVNHQLYFETEEENPVDKNAIKVLYDDFFIGYIPKNNIQSMMINYSKGNKKQVCGFTTLVDEDNKIINIGLGFYDDMDNSNIEYFDTKLIGTTKKTEFEDRQSNLGLVEQGEKVEIDYDFEIEKYIVTSDGLEIGEINKKDSNKIQDLENDGLDISAGIVSMDYDEEANPICRVRVICR